MSQQSPPTPKNDSLKIHAPLCDSQKDDFIQWKREQEYQKFQKREKSSTDLTLTLPTDHLIVPLRKLKQYFPFKYQHSHHSCMP